ncbi:LOW QUALITY PROTEIN: probable methyltransferase PMT27 [Phalaenopsis equestris]|uniref:LOW QUALITY PROTEIN: probable methyltransferase PMT27 n=1 Tax=Phalaenopsis equestris TaxID=78828 RepID=UPI0009E462EB|nr:LOW QUALITY PROTEIN: probable methyltransferase PMT27 [Phalaenopsis equestris]
MGALSKNSRGGKRGSSSFAWSSIIITLIFIAFCSLGIYILTSSPSPSSSNAAYRRSHVSLSSDRRASGFDLKELKSALDESAMQSESGISEEDSSESQQEQQNEEGETHNQGDKEASSGIESQEQIEHDTEGTVEESGEQKQSHVDDRESDEETEQPEGKFAPETEQCQDSTDGRGEEEEKKQNEEQIHEQTEKKNCNYGQPDTEQQQIEDVDTGIEIQPGLQVGANETHSTRRDDNWLEELSQSGENMPWETQDVHSLNEEGKKQKEQQQQAGISQGNRGAEENLIGYEWELCNVTAGADYIPCLDNEKALKKVHDFKHYQHRERHCPEESPTCLVPLPKGYKRSVEWPASRDKIWYNNVPHSKLAEVKGHQNWLKVDGEYLKFPGGGTQFIQGASQYIAYLQHSLPAIEWGKYTRVVLDVGCGVASFGGYLFNWDVLTMSFAPKDEHEAQVQLALERGIFPAISAVMGSQRLPFPSNVFDLIHCARCRVPWHADGGMLLLEINRLLRPGGYFVWSATPVYQKLKEDLEIWKAMSSLTESMCWDFLKIRKDKLNGVAAAFYRKPPSNECYEDRKNQTPAICEEEDDPNAAWYSPLKPCIHLAPVNASERGIEWPAEWPQRLSTPPFWLNSSQTGFYGKPGLLDFESDSIRWKRIVKKSYLVGLGINWSKIRNVMDMRAVYGGFAAALNLENVWVMNVVNIDAPDTLPIIYERGLLGIYHDWCESFNTYPRTYDLLHADHLFSKLKERCSLVPVMAEIDRIVRPGGILIVRDDSAVTNQVENLLKSLHWEVNLVFSKNNNGIIAAEKSDWRPETYSDST